MKTLGAVLVAFSVTVGVLWFVRFTAAPGIDLQFEIASWVLLHFGIVIAAITIGLAIVPRARAVGVLLVLFGLVWAVGYWLVWADQAAVATVAMAVWIAGLLLPVAAVMAAAEPPRSAWRGLGFGELMVVLVGAGMLLTAGAGGVRRWLDPTSRREVHSVIGVIDNPDLADALNLAVEVLVALVAVAAAVFLVVAAARAGRQRRRHLLPVAVAAGAAALAAVSWLVAGRLARVPLPGTPTGPVVTWFLEIHLVQLADLLVIGILGWLYIVRPVLVRTNEGRLDVTALPAATSVGRRVADMLGDRSASVHYLIDGGWVDGSGAPAPATDGIGITVIEAQGVPFTRVTHDPNVPGELAELAAHLAATSVIAERAAIDAAARRERVRRASHRLVHAEDVAVEDLAAALARGPVARLAALADDLRGGHTTLPEAAAPIQAVAADVRRISHGIYPPQLEHAGLAGALPELRVPPERFDPSIELTAYLLARESESAEIRVVDGWLEVTCPVSVATDLADRIALLGGEQRAGVVALPVEETAG
jgi:hypothetical protein